MASGFEVERSISGRAWRARVCDEAGVLAISQRLGLPEIIGRILAGRGLTPETAPAFLAPRVRATLPDPSHLLDLEVAVERLCEAVLAGETVGLLGDYDVDGATSVALLGRYLREVGATVAIDVPDRLAEGYGPNPLAFARLAAAGCRLVVTLDSGTTAFAALAGARARGLEVIVVDHHAAEPELPQALAVVNPNRLDQTSPLGDLAAVGVTFLLAVGLNRCLRERGHFAHRPEPDLRRWLDLVALGTVCDVVRLCGLNRAFVAQGLRVAARGGNPGLVALAGMAKLEGPPDAEHLGFWLGPRINAGGRVGRSMLGAALLASDLPDEVAGIALELDRLNGERRALERRVLAEAEAALAAVGTDPRPLLLCAGEGWSPGVVGLVASRLVERHHRPAVVIGLADGIGKGSGRSVAGFDLGAAVIAARREGLLLQGGGHAMAAGLTVSVERLEGLCAFLAERLRRELGPEPAPAPALRFDGSLRVAAISAGLGATIARLAPFGRGNPEPRFIVPHARIWQARRVGESHIDCRLADPAGGRVRAIAFRAANAPLGAALLEAKGAPLHLAGRIRLDRWQGETRVCLQIDDAAPASGPPIS
jgi:single-stranded-DNA-specific exonuclease